MGKLLGAQNVVSNASHIGSLPLPCLENLEQLHAQLGRWVSGFVRRALHAKARDRLTRLE